MQACQYKNPKAQKGIFLDHFKQIHTYSSITSKSSGTTMRPLKLSAASRV